MDNVSIRLANKNDAVKIFELNEEFNGKGQNTIHHIRELLEINKQEIVCIAEVNGVIAGFCCAQIIKSVCYSSMHAELTELFIKESFRRKGLARELIMYVEDVCLKQYGICKFQLLTGNDNIPAQKLYGSLGYIVDDEVLLTKEHKDL